MKEPAPTQFLDLKTYRRRRLMDAAKLLPLIGAAVFGFPLVNLFVDPNAPGALGATAIYLFSVWLVLIVCAAILARRLRENPSTR